MRRAWASPQKVHQWWNYIVVCLPAHHIFHSWNMIVSSEYTHSIFYGSEGCITYYAKSNASLLSRCQVQYCPTLELFCQEEHEASPRGPLDIATDNVSTIPSALWTQPQTMSLLFPVPTQHLGWLRQRAHNNPAQGFSAYQGMRCQMLEASSGWRILVLTDTQSCGTSLRWLLMPWLLSWDSSSVCNCHRDRNQAGTF